MKNGMILLTQHLYSIHRNNYFLSIQSCGVDLTHLFCYNGDMIKKCAICDKGPLYGSSLSRRGLAKKKGGTGRKTTRIVKRRFLPNLHKIKAYISGYPKTIYVCTKCLKSGKVKKII